MRRIMAWTLVFALPLTLMACQTDSRQQVLQVSKSQLALRNMQARAFDTNDENAVLRAVIATLQDLNFVMDKADAALGTVTATKFGTTGSFSRRYSVRMTVTVRSRGTAQTLVRANAQYGLRAIEEPQPYQQFFTALSKALFLEAHEVDHPVPASNHSASDDAIRDTGPDRAPVEPRVMGDEKKSVNR